MLAEMARATNRLKPIQRRKGLPARLKWFNMVDFQPGQTATALALSGAGTVQTAGTFAGGIAKPQPSWVAIYFPAALTSHARYQTTEGR